MDFGDSIASAVRFTVSRNDTVLSPYNFDVPVELTLPIPQDLPSAVGSNISDFILSFLDPSGNFDTNGIETTIRDSVNNIIGANIAHFSVVVMTSEDLLSDTSVDQKNALTVPSEINLHQNFPNPFNPVTTITYTLSYTEKVLLTVYDVNGNLVKTLINQVQQKNSYVVSWDGRDETGKKVGSGIYFYTLKAGTSTQTRRMLLLK